VVRAFIEWSASFGEMIVAVGTLFLAVVTWQLAKSSERSLEALDLPFLLATPNREIAFDLGTVVDDHGEAVDAEWVLYVELVNLGAGPAILDGVCLMDDATNADLVKENWEVDWLIKAGAEVDGWKIPLRHDPPSHGGLLTLKVYYRSASGNRYQTLHQIRVGKQPHAHRLSFKRERS